MLFSSIFYIIVEIKIQTIFIIFFYYYFEINFIENYCKILIISLDNKFQIHFSYDFFLFKYLFRTIIDNCLIPKSFILSKICNNE